MGAMFSFNYGGRPSEEFIRQWDRDVQVEDSESPLLRRHLITSTDPDTGLVVTHDYQRISVSATESTVTLTNTGNVDTSAISNLQALDIELSPYYNPLVLHRLKGSSCKDDDWMPITTDIDEGQKVVFSPSGGRSSNGASPFFNIDFGGHGVIIAVGWSGTWTVSLERDVQFARLKVGLDNLSTVLHPGESIRSPRVLMMHWQGNIEDSYNQFRRLMFERIMPRVHGEVVVPPIASLSNSAYRHNSQTEEFTLDHLAGVTGLGFEVFWVDAYYTRGGFPAGMGNYGLPLSCAVDPDKFPRGMGHIGNEARTAGMEFMMWFEPERVNAGTRLAVEHPEWLLTHPDPSGAKTYLLDMGNDEARAYITEYLKAAVIEYGLAWLRFDYNIDPGPYWAHADEDGRLGMHENRYIVGLYKMWDELRATFPYLKLDNCASGGRRIDLETCSRATPLWRSDRPGGLIDVGVKYEPAAQNQAMTAALSRYVPYNTSGAFGSSPYLVRSHFNGGMQSCEDCRPDNFPVDEIKAGIRECKRIRKYYAGDLYVLSPISTDQTDWSVRQYHLPDEDAGIVLAFRRPQATQYQYLCELRGIDPAGTYNVTWRLGYEQSDHHDLQGTQLQRLIVEIIDCPSSVLIEYERAPEGY